MSTKSLQIRVSADLLALVNKESARRGLRPGEFVRFLMSQAVEEKKEAPSGR